MLDLSTYVVHISLSKYFSILINATGLETSDYEISKAPTTLDVKHNAETISFSTVRQLAKTLKETSSNDQVHLCDLLRGSQIVFSPPLDVPTNDILKSRLEVLRKRAQNNEYVQMTKNVDLAYQASHMNEFRSDVQGLRSQMVAVFNLVVTVFACFLFGYKAVEYSLPSPNLAAQVISGVLVASVGAIADLYFLAKQVESTSS